ncbi:MAG: heme-binding protein [Opitutales bacterium]|nr:heme-binding protein [Opitutales bacterium]MDP4644764.1 heme-binding protein [Opitutales bacterium]MDP4777983.1 heme-binding protein [Opitutales bacterium]MDP4883826.1 heme-binding protein [Opitutales bacterium]MDP5080541.1 heme-binding protein [Opitutales bacterium]
MKTNFTILLICLFPLLMSAAEKAFPQTSVGQTEFKTLPAAHLIASQSDDGYFSNDNNLFRPLFRYISSRDIAMTTPVEAEINPGVMYFYIGKDAIDKAQDSTDSVKVHVLPERTVASIGIRGSYTEENFDNAETKLRAWLATQETYEITGEARGIFWNSPFMPGFFKRFEVHIPVNKK